MKLKLVAVVLLVGMVLKLVRSTHGADVSQGCLVNGWKCLRENGYTFGIPRCYMSSGHVDETCPHTIYNAWEGGMSHVDVYMFPCPKCGNGAGQVKTMVNYIKSYNATYGMVWLDIEGSQYWLGSKEKNIAFFKELLEGIKETGVNAGIYSGYYQWEAIMGLAYTGGSDYPLWYAHYDDSPSFSDFKAFSGWKKPAIKQYKGTTSLCGCSIDKNWYP